MWGLLLKPLLGVASSAVSGFIETKKLKQEAASNKRATSEQGKKQASNQQASRVSRTVDHGPGTPDPQA